MIINRHKSGCLIVLYLLCFYLWETNSVPVRTVSIKCPETGTYPLLIGGDLGDSVISSMDRDNLGNIVIAGYSSDTNLVSLPDQNIFGKFASSTGSFQFLKTLSSQASSIITKTLLDGSSIYVIFTPPSDNLAIFLQIDPATGNIISQLRDIMPKSPYTQQQVQLAPNGLYCTQTSTTNAFVVFIEASSHYQASWSAGSSDVLTYATIGSTNELVHYGMMLDGSNNMQISVTIFTQSLPAQFAYAN